MRKVSRPQTKSVVVWLPDQLGDKKIIKEKSNHCWTLKDELWGKYADDGSKIRKYSPLAVSNCGGFITAPPKPSVQTQFILEEMESSGQKEDERWDRMMKSIDLLFARVGDIDRVQHQMAAQIDLNIQIIDQVLLDQITLAKQLEATGQAISQLQSLNSLKSFHPLIRIPLGLVRHRSTTLLLVLIDLVVITLPFIAMLYLRCLFLISLVLILRFGKTNALITCTYSIYLRICRLLLLL